ncbi:imm11 family protein [Dyadobacter sp. CY347]|uniref:imm11 family protein n=1 Tax=Dyadobacter sp. CY347 TaxID=2909336 RepID=UPI001F1D123C|nr:DUF1629 domain-containing protein [Dyadobacter sp. CY347]MCF2488012.1 hypothetical protein [Dyadobacter sp. CY347]
MKYYALTYSLNPKLCGPFPQVEDTSSTGNENSIENFDLKFIATDVLVPQVSIYNRAKPTDIISGVSAEFMSNLLVSGKLKNILDKYSPEAFQYFKTVVGHRGSVYDDYWFVHPTRESLESVDFFKSQVIKAPFFELQEGKGITEEVLSVIDADGFIQERARNQRDCTNLDEYIRIANLALLDSDETPQFLYLRFVEGAFAYIVSETLKQQIIDAGCFGVEFRPIEMSFNDWHNYLSERSSLTRQKSKVSKKAKPVLAVENNMPSENIGEITVNELANWIKETRKRH